MPTISRAGGFVEGRQALIGCSEVSSNRWGVTAYLFLHLSVLLWGLTALLGKVISLNPLLLIFLRQVIACLVILVVWRRAVLTPQWRVLFGVGFVVALHWLLFFASVQWTGIAVTVICLSTGGLWAALLDPLVSGQKLRKLDLVFGAVAVVGVSFLVGSRPEVDAPKLILGLSAALASAVFSVLNSRLVKRYSDVQLSFWELLGGVFWSGLILLMFPRWQLSLFSISRDDWLGLFILGIFCTVLPWIWTTRVLRELSPFTVLLAVNLEPIYSILLAYWLFPETERLDLPFYLGTALILSLVLLHGGVSRALARRRSAQLNLRQLT